MAYPTICEPCLLGNHQECVKLIDPPTPEQLEEGFCGGGVCVCTHGEEETAFQREIREREETRERI